MKKTRLMIVAIFSLFIVIVVSGVVFFGKSTTPQTSTSLQNARMQQEISGEEYAVKKEDQWNAFDDGYLDITTYDYFKQAEELTIPAEYDGIKIKIFSVYFEGVYENNPYLKRIVIENGIQEMDTSFIECNALESVKIPKSVKKIPKYAFNDVKKSVILYVEKGSYAEQYAKKKKFHYKYMNET